jgi:hypothetical protein
LADHISSIKVTDLGEFIRHESCERRFKLGFNKSEIAQEIPFFRRVLNSIDPVLQASGRKRENDWAIALEADGLVDVFEDWDSAEDYNFQDFLDKISTIEPGIGCYGREVVISGEIGKFSLSGRIDFLLLKWVDDKPFLVIVETKDSRKDKTYHRIQVATYYILARQLIPDAGINIGGNQFPHNILSSLVARIDEETNQPQDILAMESIPDIDREISDIFRLLSPEGKIARILTTDLWNLEYVLNQKCDGCVFNTNCFPESARLRKLQLIGLDPSAIRVLQSNGVNTIDELAELNPESEISNQIQRDQNFGKELGQLIQKAQARRTNLPGRDRELEEYSVTSLHNAPQSQLPSHIQGEERLLRIFMNIDYDYIENRIVAISAHVTRSEGKVHTKSDYLENGDWEKYNPQVYEKFEDDSILPLEGKFIINKIESEWTGNYAEDTGIEKQLIQSFFRNLINSIAEEAASTTAKLHFYVWSRSEMTQLIESCARVDSRLLGNLRELFGCRESLEQLIFSTLKDEVSNRFGLGWTANGLVVATSFSWFGDSYHWNRLILGNEERLDFLYTQDIFDYKTDLILNADGEWGDPDEKDPDLKNKFEVRSRFNDGITAPYWYAYWNAPLFPNPEDPSIPNDVKAALNRYKDAVSIPTYLEEYIKARLLALRWVEEKIIFKNDDIEKPLLTISELPNFNLGVENIAQSSIDFLRLDQHVRTTDWFVENFGTVRSRIAGGKTLPLRNLRAVGGNILMANIDFEAAGMELDYLRANSKLQTESFARISVYSGNPNVGQSLSQLTNAGSACNITQLNWDSGEVIVECIPANASRYILPNTKFFFEQDPLFDGFATLDENVSDFVAGHVESRLLQPIEAPTYDWFDPISPEIPEATTPNSEILDSMKSVLSEHVIYESDHLAQTQREAVYHGLSSTVQLIQGPPGTGKTLTTAVATLSRIMLTCESGDIVLVAANTHNALDNLLMRIQENVINFSQAATKYDFDLPDLCISKVHSSDKQLNENPLEGDFENFAWRPSKNNVARLRQDKVLIIGGTTSALLKLIREIPGNDLPDGIQTKLLVVDEASMMVFPHFLAISTSVANDGKIIVAGDHRQLAPIVAHDWEKEDRPPVQLYQPYLSAYLAIDNIFKNHPGISESSLKRSALNFTFRLPPIIRKLIAKLYKSLDAIDLKGSPRDGESIPDNGKDILSSLDSVWSGETGLFLVTHSERQSKRFNRLEAEIIRQIMEGSPELDEDSVAIVTPYRAQKSLLMTSLGDAYDSLNIIDTVERLQGGQRPAVIVSAVASDPYAIGSNEQFILNLNRSNVAFSRSQDRLIVICSEEVINHIPTSMEQYDSTLLWKALANICSLEIAKLDIEEHSVRVFTPQKVG